MTFYKTQTDTSRVPLEEGGILDGVEVISADRTLTVEDSGKTFLVATDALTITLPATAYGVEYEFINTGADGNNTITVSPNAADAIQGSFSNAGQNIEMTGTDDKDIVNTKATAKTGDRLSIIGDGSTGWQIKSGIGIWTEESQTVAYSPIEVVTDDRVITAADSGKTFLIATDAKTFTLPATAKGLEFTFINSGADANNTVTVSPNASDAIHGSYANAGQNIELSGTDDKDLVNTKATAKTGDRLTLVGDGTAGWYVKNAIGVWTEESQTVAYSPVEVVTDDRVITAVDNGKTFLIATDAKTFTLPATELGLEFIFVNSGADGNNILTISPNASDGIFGSLPASAGSNADATTADGLVSKASGTDDKDWVNTKATANQGDWCKLVGDGSAGWFIVGGVGIWASEA